MVSILMPLRNALPFLRDCLDSILQQTYSNWELIVVNDHSSDGSEVILQEYHEKDRRIKWFQNEGKGIIDALKMAYSKSEGTLISRMDADDLMPERKLELLRAALIEQPDHLATGFVSYFSHQGKLGAGFRRYEQWLNDLCLNNAHYGEIYKECVIPSPCWMVHRKTFERIGAFETSVYPEDYDLAFRMYREKVPVIGIQEVLHHWRDHGDRASRNDPNYADHSFLDLKLGYFLELDHDPERPLYIWGAGKKGKRAAQFLIDQKCDFHWISDNEQKIGKDIYGKIIQHSAEIETGGTVVVLVANPNEQQAIERQLEKVDVRTFWFC